MAAKILRCRVVGAPQYPDRVPNRHLAYHIEEDLFSLRGGSFSRTIEAHDKLVGILIRPYLAKQAFHFAQMLRYRNPHLPVLQVTIQRAQVQYPALRALF